MTSQNYCVIEGFSTIILRNKFFFNWAKQFSCFTTKNGSFKHKIKVKIIALLVGNYYDNKSPCCNTLEQGYWHRKEDFLSLYLHHKLHRFNGLMHIQQSWDIGKKKTFFVTLRKFDALES